MADGAHRTKSASGSEGNAFGADGSTGASGFPDRLSFGVIDPAEARPAPKKTRFPWVAVAFFLAALIAVASFRSVWLRSLLPLSLVVGGVAVMVRYRARSRQDVALERKRAPRALVLDSSGLTYELVRRSVPSALAQAPSGASQLIARGDDAPMPLLDGSQRFGATLLSNARRDKLALAITSSQGTFLVGTQLSEDDNGLTELFARSSVVGSDEAPLDATGPDGKPVCLPPETFKKLFDSLVAIDPNCASRLVLTDQRGNPLELEGSTLTVRGVRFDLSRPLEWRSLVFQEPFGHAINLYQGTWVRQGSHEIVLVSLMSPSQFETTMRGGLSSEAPSSIFGGHGLDKMAQRDHRLLQAAAGDPPPIDSRVAMDGLFVVPIRAALDDAPRPSSEERRRTPLAT